MRESLKQLDFVEAAQLINCEVAVIKAVCEVEAPKGGFLKNDKPVILYEPFQFGDLTKQKFDGTVIQIDKINYPLSLNRRKLPWTVKNAKYGPSSIQHEKLEAAKKLDNDSAIKACSWGRFQLMGFNYKLCGFETLKEFVEAMYEGEREHLFAFVHFIKNMKLDDELREKNFETFAFHYNGPKQDKGTTNEKDDYDYFLQQAYKKYVA